MAAGDHKHVWFVIIRCKNHEEKEQQKNTPNGVVFVSLCDFFLPDDDKTECL